MVGVCVRTNAQVVDCVDALLPVMKRGSVLMIHSTVSPDTVKAAAKRAEPYAITVIDTTITVTRYDGADAPFVCMMIGGGDAADERTKPLLQACATDVVHVGPLGSAMSSRSSIIWCRWCRSSWPKRRSGWPRSAVFPAEALQAVMKSNGALTPTMMAIASRAGQPPADEHTAALRSVQASNGVKDLALAEALAKSVDTASATATFAKSQYWFSYAANLPNR